MLRALKQHTHLQSQCVRVRSLGTALAGFSAAGSHREPPRCQQGLVTAKFTRLLTEFVFLLLHDWRFVSVSCWRFSLSCQWPPTVPCHMSISNVATDFVNTSFFKASKIRSYIMKLIYRNDIAVTPFVIFSVLQANHRSRSHLHSRKGHYTETGIMGASIWESVCHTLYIASGDT